MTSPTNRHQKDLEVCLIPAQGATVATHVVLGMCGSRNRKLSFLR